MCVPWLSFRPLVANTWLALPPSSVHLTVTVPTQMFVGLFRSTLAATVANRCSVECLVHTLPSCSSNANCFSWRGPWKLSARVELGSLSLLQSGSCGNVLWKMHANTLRLHNVRCWLFQEAHKMVREANVKQATAEKQLKEAQGKVSLTALVTD